MRTALKPVRKSNQGIKSKLKVINCFRRYLRKLRRDADIYSTQQIWYDSIAKRLLPSRIDVYETHVEFNRKTIVRSIIISGQRGDYPTFPPSISSKSFEDIMKLGGTKGCKISISEKLIKKPSRTSSKELQDAYREVNVEQYKVQMNDPAGGGDLGLKKQKEDIEERHNDIWDLGENAFQSQTIITIKGTEEEVLRAESYILSKLDSEIIQHFDPEDLHLEAFLAGGPFPRSDPRFFVEVPSSLAAKLTAMTNINTRFDPFGLLFGKSRETNADVIKDLRLLPAKHLIMFGATGSGKTYAAMVLLMRLHDMLNHRIVYMSRKAPDRKQGATTDYEAVARFYGENATILDIEKIGINPLQMVFDEKNMLPSDYPYIWNHQRKAISAFFKSWFGKDFTPNMEGLLEETLDIVYEKADIYPNKPATWKKPFPTMKPLRQLWFNIMKDKDGQSVEDRRTAGAMYRKTRAVKEGGTMGYLLKDTNFKYKDWMVISLHNVDERIQDPLYILITSILSMRFNIDTSKETVIFVDEARALLRNPEVSQFLLDGITMWRSKGVALWLATQQPKDLKKANVEEEFSTNTFMSIVMGAEMTPKTVGYVQEYFGFADSVLNDLLTCNQGEGILTVSGEVTPFRIEATPVEDRIITGKFESDSPVPVGGYRVKSIFLEKSLDGKNFIEKHGFWLKEMLEGGDENAVLQDGWLKYNVPKVTGGRGSTNLYYKDGTLNFDSMLVTAPGYGKMSIDHLHVVLQKEVFLVEREYKVSANPNGDADLIFEKRMSDGKIHVYGGEYEEEGSHTKEELIQKWGRLMKYDDYRFIASDTKFLINAGIPERYIVKRGKEFVDWIDSLEPPVTDDNSIKHGDEDTEEKTVPEDGEISHETQASEDRIISVELEPVIDGINENGAI